MLLTSFFNLIFSAKDKAYEEALNKIANLCINEEVCLGSKYFKDCFNWVVNSLWRYFHILDKTLT